MARPYTFCPRKGLHLTHPIPHLGGGGALKGRPRDDPYSVPLMGADG